MNCKTPESLIEEIEREKSIYNFVADFRIALLKAGGNGNYELFKNKPFSEVISSIAPNSLKIIYETK